MASNGKTLTFLYGLQKSGIKAGLKNIRAILTSLDNPQNDFPAIHIAGTNGKGSTASMIAAALTAAGYRTGLYTSPHLIEFRERIRINGRKIPEAALARYVRAVRPAVEKTRATFFDATTAIAFRYFADRNVDIAVIETGLGGRWDSTNVVRPLLGVITSIGLEHREYLGSTIRKIAFEKAGIIKRGVPLVTGAIGGPAMDVIVKQARRRGSRVYEYEKRTSVALEYISPDHASADFVVMKRSIAALKISPSGCHQITNARTALLALEILRREEESFRVRESDVRKGLSQLQAMTGFYGRLQVVKRNPEVIIDVAHNPDGIRSLVRTLSALGYHRLTVVLGVLDDKDYASMIDILKVVTSRFVFVRPGSPRARNVSDLVDFSRKSRFPAFSSKSVKEGIRFGIRENPPGGAILITGSHYVAGEAIAYFKIRT